MGSCLILLCYAIRNVGSISFKKFYNNDKSKCADTNSRKTAELGGFLFFGKLPLTPNILRYAIYHVEAYIPSSCDFYCSGLYASARVG